MDFWITISVLIVIIIVIAWVTHYLFKNGKLPDGIFKESYENMLSTYQTQVVDKYFLDPESLFAKTIGYENDATAKLALEKALHREEMYIKNEKNGKVSPIGMKEAAVNSFVIASLYHYNVAPNLTGDKKLKAEANAAVHYTRAINRIDNNPAAAILGPAEFIIDRAETFYREQPQTGTQTFVPDFNRVRDNVREARAAKQTDPLGYFAPRQIQTDPHGILNKLHFLVD